MVSDGFDQDEKTTQEPVVNKTKVNQTTEAYNEENKDTITQSKNSSTNEPHNSTKTQSSSKVDKPNTKAVSKFLKTNRGKIALGAIGVGLAKSVIDGDDDDLTSSIAKGIKTGAVATGLSYAGQYLLNTDTVQDIVSGKTLSESDKAIKDRKLERNLIKGGGKAASALKIGMYALGAATVLDIGHKIGDHMESDKMNRDQEKKLKEKKKREKEKNKKYSYGYLDQGEIVMDMFNQRTGHYKMGNAKFN